MPKHQPPAPPLVFFVVAQHEPVRLKVRGVPTGEPQKFHRIRPTTISTPPHSAQTTLPVASPSAGLGMPIGVRVSWWVTSPIDRLARR